MRAKIFYYERAASERRRMLSPKSRVFRAFPFFDGTWVQIPKINCQLTNEFVGRRETERERNGCKSVRFGYLYGRRRSPGTLRIPGVSVSRAAEGGIAAVLFCAGLPKSFDVSRDYNNPTTTSLRSPAPRPPLLLLHGTVGVGSLRVATHLQCIDYKHRGVFDQVVDLVLAWKIQGCGACLGGSLVTFFALKAILVLTDVV